MDVNNVCQYLDWDSKFFERRIARITPHRLDRQVLAQVMTWCDANQIDCLYFLSAVDDPDTTRLAEDNNFRFVDIRLTLENRLHGYATTEVEDFIAIRLCTPQDVPALRAIAKVSHHDSRFYADPQFPSAACDALYETWIEKSCSGYADAVLVAELQGEAVGYVSCHLMGEARGKIGLVAVGANAQGRGLGRKLLNESLRWFWGFGVKDVTVCTQGRNIAAQRLYQRCGFLTRSVQLWYHRWF